MKRVARSLLALPCVLTSQSGLGRTTALLNVLWDSLFVYPYRCSERCYLRDGLLLGT